jgi:GNAT superfamily N-acetyltransferase
MGEGVVVRAMCEEDLLRVSELACELGYPSTLEVALSRFRRVVDRPEQAVLVATATARVVGWLHAQVHLTLEADPCVEITGLVVGLEARRSGVGRALVERAAGWARDLGYASLRVRSNVQRTAAHEFYPALGFRLEKTQRTYTRALVHAQEETPR